MARIAKQRQVKEAGLAYAVDPAPVALLRPKNQITLPLEVVDRIGAQPGDRFIVDAPNEPFGEVRLRKLPRSYAGTLDGVWGSHDQVIDYLREERGTWGG
ncbi:MAG TPA: hypothetical protein VG815_03355 [Chloroflexota bacterium]|jgi:hypothetical protein|nr:hypothetical protein [Chloroflexota bacterium]